MEVILVIRLLLMLGKIALYVVGALFLVVIAFVGFVFYCICTSEDNCTGCPGALDGSCRRCRIHKNKVKQQKKEAKKRNEGGNQ